MAMSTTTPALLKKYHLRGIFRAVSLIVLVLGYSTYNYINKSNNINDVNVTAVPEESSDTQSSLPFTTTNTTDIISHRNLEENCDDQKIADPSYTLIFYILGVLYTFLALAVACDEFFVPALEEMSSPRHMNLSMDVAGATLMAAGGSAPELFTALVGTFAESEIGFGAIVGSAVFNVLFVIAMCSFLSKEVLNLTWWPLLRDSAYYVFGLLVLALFVGYISPGEVSLWEAIVLFIMYFGYVILMKYNGQLYTLLTGKPVVDPGKDDNSASLDLSYSLHEDNSNADHTHSSQSRVNYTHGRWPGTFRAGIIKLLRQPKSWEATAGLGIVAQIAGDVEATFKHIDKNGDGTICKEELKLLFEDLNVTMTAEEFEDAFQQLDKNQDGHICEQEFTEYYIRSQTALRTKMKTIFDTFDTNNSNTIDRTELQSLLTKLEPTTTTEDIDKAMSQVSTEEISFEEFAEWFGHSILFEKGIHDVKHDMSGAFDHLRPPEEGGFWSYFSYVLYLPLLLVYTFTIPDTRRPGWGRWCYISFLLSIVWIGIFSYFMVDWAEVIGNTLGIPSVVMGLTFIAAGTSVPDLLSSVIVARRGEGDMAVSSSVGSNIFDILVGLPVPWILYTIVKEKPVEVGAEGLGISIIILLVMVVAVIGTIHFNKWKLTNVVGGIMLLLYTAFLAQAIIRNLPFQKCG